MHQFRLVHGAARLAAQLFHLPLEADNLVFLLGYERLLSLYVVFILFL